MVSHSILLSGIGGKKESKSAVCVLQTDATTLTTVAIDRLYCGEGGNGYSKKKKAILYARVEKKRDFINMK